MNDSISIIKNEGINIYSVASGNKDEPRQAIVCTYKGSELNLNSYFFEQYSINEIFSVKTNSSGYLERAFEYDIINKLTGEIIYQQ